MCVRWTESFLLAKMLEMILPLPKVFFLESYKSLKNYPEKYSLENFKMLYKQK